MVVGVLGAGTMGAGIAQVAAQKECEVVLVDLNQDVLTKAENNLDKVLARLVEKNTLSADDKINIQGRISYSTDIADFRACKIVIEAIVEKLEIKHSVFKQLEAVVSDECILASNTSSLSIASIGAALINPSRVIGIHFFNPAPLMPLVEIIPAVQTSIETFDFSKKIIDSWGKFGVVCKDTQVL
jgi:3-hydroxybutyryl-CoA dehydrogenase